MTEYVVGTFAFRFLSAPGQCRSAALYVVSFVQYKWLFVFGCWSSIITVHVLIELFVNSADKKLGFFGFFFYHLSDANLRVFYHIYAVTINKFIYILIDLIN